MRKSSNDVIVGGGSGVIAPISCAVSKIKQTNNSILQNIVPVCIQTPKTVLKLDYTLSDWEPLFWFIHKISYPNSERNDTYVVSKMYADIEVSYCKMKPNFAQGCRTRVVNGRDFNARVEE